MKTLTFQLSQIDEVAQKIVAEFNRPIILFYGLMGAGKTTFIQALIKQLGFKNSASSPTFSLVNEYHQDQKKIYHFDLYRLKSFQEALDFGIEEYLDSGHYCLIEWPEHILPLLDIYHIIKIQVVDEETRLIELI